MPLTQIFANLTRIIADKFLESANICVTSAGICVKIFYVVYL